jgi:hypothetical protein
MAGPILAAIIGEHKALSRYCVGCSASPRAPVVVYYARRINPLTQRRHFKNAHYTAVVQQKGAWWIGWVKEIPVLPEY